MDDLIQLVRSGEPLLEVPEGVGSADGFIQLAAALAETNTLQELRLVWF